MFRRTARSSRTARTARSTGTARTTAVLAATAAAATALVLAASTTSTAAVTAPRFLSGTDLPPHPGSAWYAGKVTKGLPEFPPFCADGVLPATGIWYRDFGTEFDTNAVQVSVRTSSSTAAIKLKTALERKVAACAADWLRATPGGTASWQDYGKLSVEEGAHVYGVHTSMPESEPGVHLFGIGRDGSTVTFVRWGQMGNLSHAPVPAFKKTTVRAVNKLNP
ncbi:hypothetical protein ACODT5_27060 [Streptomyces sp. 5.8]|uniref:hypothetical protein n=1 Tax=Streptomyces sp. 5.8 TaxID=3406571 RepID=UPI003BB77E8D